MYIILQPKSRAELVQKSDGDRETPLDASSKPSRNYDGKLHISINGHDLSAMALCAPQDWLNGVRVMSYGMKELAYAQPFADRLQSDHAFRSWVLRKTEFKDVAEDARLLAGEMLALRGPGTAFYWRSHYTEKCRCAGCSGQETDVLSVFEGPSGDRFAIHTEVKHPGDKFGSPRQAASYRLRARCWSAKPPKSVVPHSRAATMLLCSEAKLGEYDPHLAHFDTVLTFEEIEAACPGMYPKEAA